MYDALLGLVKLEDGTLLWEVMGALCLGERLSFALLWLERALLR
jgi:hypothetical protein